MEKQPAVGLILEKQNSVGSDGAGVGVGRSLRYKEIVPFSGLQEISVSTEEAAKFP